MIYSVIYYYSVNIFEWSCIFHILKENMFYYIWQIIYDFFSTTSCDKFSLERYELIGRVTRTSNTTLNANVEYKRKSLTQGFLKLQKFLKTHILRKKGGRVVYCCWSWNYTLEQMEKNVTIFVDAYFTGVPFW